MGIKWVVGNGEKVRFWEDQWLGNTRLPIVFWLLYVINEQQGQIVSQVWDGQELNLSFRRNVYEAFYWICGWSYVVWLRIPHSLMRRIRFCGVIQRMAPIWCTPCMQ